MVQSMHDTTKTATTTTTQASGVLTRSVIASLVTDLDASDVLECYALTRKTKLHVSATTNHSITITKAALGLRQRSVGIKNRRRHDHNKPLELTLEFGPARVQATQQEHYESVPHVLFETNEPGSTPLSVAWENQARVYYTTTEIASGQYPTANYLASVSGAVLNSLLLTAVEYTTASHLTSRYQPFAVYNQEDKLLIHSSSDVDFILYLYKHLAGLGVALQPVILPAHQQVRLHALGDKELLQTGTEDLLATDVALFYARLTRCVQAIATADYSAYDTGDEQTTPSSAPSAAPSAAPSSGARRRRRRSLLEQNETTVDSHDTDEDILLHATVSSTNTTNSTETNQTTSPSLAPSLMTNTAAPSHSPPTSAKSQSEQTAQAAAQAQQAADQAEEAGNAQAAHAAQAAATAAQRAADLTASQQAAIRMEALLSGDAHAMASTVSLCFSDPMFGLIEPNANSTTTYLYWDGVFYLRVELVDPYITVQPLDVVLPQAAVPGNGGGVKGDVVDWTLALLILGFFVFGFLLLLQQVLGRNLRIIRPLYKFQRWFFDPTQYDLQRMDDQSEAPQRGMGREYTFGEDVIPLSMGGRKADVSSISSRDGRSRESGGPLLRTTRLPSGGDVELVTRSVAVSPSSHGLNNRSYHSVGESSAESELSFEDFAASDHPTRLFRDPDLVDLPDLKSKSKVAVPVSLTVGSVGGSSHAASLDESSYT